jgi:hypothetical protein
MHGNFIIGLLTMAVCLAIQCLVLGLLLRLLIHLEKKQVVKPTFPTISGLLIAVMLIMMVGNLLQMSVWAILFVMFNEFHDFATAFYHSVVNFATLGYGDLVMSEKRRILGALEAVNGVLMFGLSTGFLYTVLSALMRRAWDRRIAPETTAKV